MSAGGAIGADATSEDIRVRRDAAAGRFEILVDNVVAGVADYGDETSDPRPGHDRPAGVRTFPHTVVAADYGGRGLAGKLIGEALRVTREEGFSVRPSCSFVARYIEKNPGSADLA